MFDKVIAALDVEINQLKVLLEAKKNQRKIAVATSTQALVELRTLAEKIHNVYGAQGLAEAAIYIGAYSPEAQPVLDLPLASVPEAQQTLDLPTPLAEVPPIVEPASTLTPPLEAPAIFIQPTMSLATNRPSGWIYFDQEAWLEQKEGIEVDDMSLNDEKTWKLLQDGWRVTETQKDDIITTTFSKDGQQFTYETTPLERTLINKLFAISEEEIQELRPLFGLIKPPVKFLFFVQHLVGLVGKEVPKSYLSAKQVIKSLSHRIVGMDLPTADGRKARVKVGKWKEAVAPFLSEDENEYLKAN